MLPASATGSAAYSFSPASCPSYAALVLTPPCCSLPSLSVSPLLPSLLMQRKARRQNAASDACLLLLDHEGMPCSAHRGRR